MYEYVCGSWQIIAYCASFIKLWCYREAIRVWYIIANKYEVENTL